MPLPMVAGEAIITVYHQAHTLQPWPGFGVFCLYASAPSRPDSS